MVCFRGPFLWAFWLACRLLTTTRPATTVRELPWFTTILPID